MRPRWLGALAFCVLASSSHAADPVTLAIADFDYLDTSGETTDQAAAHAERILGVNSSPPEATAP